MRFLLVTKRASEKAVGLITKSLDELNVPYKVCQSLAMPDFNNADSILVFGSDGDVLQTLHQMGSKSIPILGVSESEGGSFLMELGMSDLREALPSIMKGKYYVEEAGRLAIKIDDKELPSALNEVAIFPSRSAAIMEYLLQVDGEMIWRDLGDGVIVATPTGSTAYAMSAGGPMIHIQARVHVVVPVNSMDITRRPLVISDISLATLTEIGSRYDCEAIIDGTRRVKVKNKLEVTKALQPARLIRLPQVSPTVDKMTRKVRLAEDLQSMPPSAKLILKTLQYEGPLTQRDLMTRTILPGRTTRLALALLIQKGLVRSQLLLGDTRRRMYYIV